MPSTKAPTTKATTITKDSITTETKDQPTTLKPATTKATTTPVDRQSICMSIKRVHYTSCILCTLPKYFFFFQKINKANCFSFIPGPPDLFCLNKPNGQYAFEYDQSRFFSCNNNAPDGGCQNCPGGLVFKEACALCLRKDDSKLIIQQKAWNQNIIIQFWEKYTEKSNFKEDETFKSIFHLLKHFIHIKEIKRIKTSRIIQKVIWCINSNFNF